MKKTEKAMFFEETYNNLSYCHDEIKFDELKDFEIDRAEKLINFCRVMCEEFKEDKRFKNCLRPRTDEVYDGEELLNDLIESWDEKCD